MNSILRNLLVLVVLVLGDAASVHAAGSTPAQSLVLDDEPRPAWWPAHRHVRRDLRPAVVGIEPIRGDVTDSDDRNPDTDRYALDLTIRF